MSEQPTPYTTHLRPPSGSRQSIAIPEATRIYVDLSEKWPPGLIRMIIRDLERILNREEKARRMANAETSGSETSKFTTP